MADTPFPLPRQRRETDVLTGNGGATYGPFNDFWIFDPEDVKVLAKPAGGVSFLPVAGVVVTKTAADVYSPFTVTFPAAVPATTKFVVRGRRTPKRDVSVLRGGSISTPQLEAELSRIAATEQELVRDAENAWRSEPGQAGRYILGGEPDQVAVYDEAGNISRVTGFSVKSFLKSVADVATNVTRVVTLSAAAAISAAAAAGSAGLAAGYASDMSTRSDSVLIYATVLGMSALSLPAGLNAFRTNGYAAAGDFGGWPLAVEIPIISADKPWNVVTNNGTRRWELRTDMVWLEMLAGKGDYASNVGTATDNYQPFMDALAYRRVNQGTFNVGGGVVQIGFGNYFVSKTISLQATVQILGFSSGQQGGFNSTLTFPEDTIGIIGQRYNTGYDQATGHFTESPDNTATRGADGTLIQYVNLNSRGGTDRTKHGIMQRCRMKVVDCFIQSFPGDGIRIDVTAGNGTANREGNANNFDVIGGRIINCQNGIYINGADANAGVTLHVDCSSNRAWGIYDGSFLGNMHYGGHFNGNGKAGQVSYNGNRYNLVADDETLGSTTEPGTNSAVWAFHSTGGVGTGIFPNWVAGTTYYRGGPFSADSNNGYAKFDGCYVEGGQPPSYVNFPGCIVGGTNINNRGSGAWLKGRDWSGLGVTTGRTFAVDVSGVADVEGFSVWNRVVGATRWSRVGFYAGVLADGVTKRAVGRVSGRSSSADLTVSTEMSVDVWDGTANAFLRSLTLSGQNKSIEPGSDNGWSLGRAAARFTQVFAANGAIQTSDERTKQQMEAIPDEWLDAWSEVQWCRFKFNDAVAEKGEDGARWHFGLIAQRVADVFVKQDIDPYSAGLVCYDEWSEQREEIIETVTIPAVTEPIIIKVPVLDEQNAMTGEYVEEDSGEIRVIEEERVEEIHTGEFRVIRQAGNLYGIRYEEAFAIEAAYQRRRMDRIEAALQISLGSRSIDLEACSTT